MCYFVIVSQLTVFSITVLFFISSMIYNPSTNELVTSGPGHLTVRFYVDFLHILQNIVQYLLLSDDMLV